jgi:cation diffusion facilitator family transporter
MKKISDVRVVATSFTVSIIDVVFNFIVAMVTGSTVMLAQALQGMSDLITGGILYFGVKRSKRTATSLYQFGYGREVFFWVLMAGILMFIGTGGLSFYFGWQQFTNPQAIENVGLAFAMLIIGIAANGYALGLSVHRLKYLHKGFSWWHQLRHSSAAETKATFLIDVLGTSSAVLGIIALSAFVLTNNPQFDGLGSMAIGLSMMGMSLLLLRDVRDFIVGRAVEPHIAERIIGAAQSVKGVQDVLDLRTMYLGSSSILVILEVHLHDGLETNEIEAITDNVKEVVQENIPEVHHIQVEIETPDGEIRPRKQKIKPNHK